MAAYVEALNIFLTTERTSKSPGIIVLKDLNFDGIPELIYAEQENFSYNNEKMIEPLIKDEVVLLSPDLRLCRDKNTNELAWMNSFYNGGRYGHELVYHMIDFKDLLSIRTNFLNIWGDWIKEDSTVTYYFAKDRQNGKLTNEVEISQEEQKEQEEEFLLQYEFIEFPELEENMYSFMEGNDLNKELVMKYFSGWNFCQESMAYINYKAK